MNALFQLISRGSPELFQDIDTKVRDHSGFLFRTEVFALEILVVEAVEKEVHQVGYYGLRAFCFKQFHQMIVGGRHEFYKNLSYYADFWLFLICDRKVVKILYDLAAHLFELAVRRFAGNEFAAAVFPLLKERIRLARFFFIRSHTVQAAHKDIAEYESENNLVLGLTWTADNRVLAVGDQAALVSDGSFAFESCSYDGRTVTAYCLTDSRAVVSVSNYAYGGDSTLLIFGSSAQPVEAALPGRAAWLSSSGSKVAALLADRVVSVDLTTGRVEAACEDVSDTKGIAMGDESTVYMLGVQEIRKENLKVIPAEEELSSAA